MDRQAFCDHAHNMQTFIHIHKHTLLHTNTHYPIAHNAWRHTPITPTYHAVNAYHYNTKQTIYQKECLHMFECPGKDGSAQTV